MGGGEDMYFSVGYPLGFNKLNNTSEPEYGISIEIKSVIVQLSAIQSIIYNHILTSEKQNYKATEAVKNAMASIGIKNSDFQETVIELVNLGAVYDINSDENFLKQLGGFKIFRQGAANIIAADLKESDIIQPCIQHNNIDIPITDFQLEIWRKANGSNTINDIYLNHFSSYKLSNFIHGIRFLKSTSSVIFS
jgi:hypothetical protein